MPEPKRLADVPPHAKAQPWHEWIWSQQPGREERAAWYAQQERQHADAAEAKRPKRRGK